MPFRDHSSHQTKTTILIGAISVVLYLILGIAFFVCLSVNNYFLRHINRTLATTLLTFTAMSIAMHAVYGGFDVGRKKNKPVISAMISGIAITDIITYIQLQIMNVNPNNNATLILFGPDLLYLLLCYVIQVIVIILFVRVGNQLYFYFTPPRRCLLILGSPSQEEALRAKIERYRLQWRVEDTVLYNVPDLAQRIEMADVIFLGAVPDRAKVALLKLCYDDRKDVMCKAELEDIMLCNARPTIVDDAAFLSMEYNKITPFQRFAKRFGDILISLFALIVFFDFHFELFNFCEVVDNVSIDACPAQLNCRLQTTFPRNQLVFAVEGNRIHKSVDFHTVFKVFKISKVLADTLFNLDVFNLYKH